MPSEKQSRTEAFTKACAYVMPLGQYTGKTLARIGASKEGLLYLDWMVGRDWVQEDLRDALNDYLGHEAIQRQLDTYVNHD